MRYILLLYCVLVAAIPVSAQDGKKNVAASNGVEVMVIADDFADRTEYGVVTHLPDLQGYAAIGRLKTGGQLRPFQVGVGIYYSDSEWHFYDRALVRGGGALQMGPVNRNVRSCRNGNCSYRETFTIHLTPEQIAAFKAAKLVEFQIRGQRGDPVMISIPIENLHAVEEVSGR